LLGDWENPYITMDPDAEAEIVATFLTFLEKGSVYRGVKPVLWSVVEKTALAEAEVEYEDKTSSSLYVRFKIQTSTDVRLQEASAIIWTTTPWSLPGNRAIAYHPEVDYALLLVRKVEPISLALPQEKILVAQALIEQVSQKLGIVDSEVLASFKGIHLEGMKASHPFAGQGYEHDVPFLPGDHVAVDTGTGLVHTAPSHGVEDYELGKRYQLEVPETVLDDGTYASWVPLFAGDHVFKVDDKIIALLAESKALAAKELIRHSYPHSWRSKAPLIYRTTPQWFISLDTNHLRQQALSAIEGVQWYPSQSKNRIKGMVENRPDWCISRQRAWGVPLTIFVHKETKQPLVDSTINQRIIEAVRQEGAEAWYKNPDRFLGHEYSIADYEPINDILDVWFDSGSTQKFVLEKRPELAFPASLYLEGSDQHRGWFMSSLLLGCGTKNQAPYKAVVTHGFTVDEQGRKMSKSQGNVVAPDKIAETLGVEILRLWVVSCDYSDDLRIGPEILKHQEDIYRRFRNTLRYLLGALHGFTQEEHIPFQEMPTLERWVLHRLYQLDRLFKESVQAYNFQAFYSALHHFCSADLSAFYFDIRKDSVYCDSSQDLKRRATRTVFDLVLSHLLHWLSPVLCFTAEEAWLARFGEGFESIHLNFLPEAPESWKDETLEQEFDILRAQRRVITGALEVARTQGLIKSSLQAYVTVFDPQKNMLPRVDYAELAITSNLTISQETIPSTAFTSSDFEHLGVHISVAPGHKCERCWRVLEEVGSHSAHTTLCGRCSHVIEELN
jgi:isoleucyl-tRNA synthetase